MTKHQKHAKLNRPELENWARRSVAFVGAPCQIIEEVIAQLKKELESTHRVITVDADHKNHEPRIKFQLNEKITEWDAFTDEQWFEDKLLGQYFDLALINGNHYPAPHQVVFLDSRKEDSLRRRLDQLIDVVAYIKVDRNEFEWLEIKDGVPVFELNQAEDLLQHVRTWYKPATPELHALILAGGESRRMGHDKSQIIYHEEPQEVHLAKLCEALDIPTYISKRETEESRIGGFEVIKDSFLGMGPYGAILSAFQIHRNKALLVLACDLPIIQKAHIEKLIKARDSSQFMTALKAQSKSFAEPLAAIYEPRMYPRMLHALALGYNCPTKVLRNTDIKYLEVDDQVVMNVNTPEELSELKGGH